MKTIKIVCFLFLLGTLAISYSCSDDSNDKELTYEMFANSLVRDMNYDQFVDLFGKPNRDEGSGLHIYIWTLENGTEVSVGFAGGYIYYAYHIDKEGKVIKTILEPEE